MNSGIPARDNVVQQNGQISTIWLLFFERLYSIYLELDQSNTEGIAAVREIANSALSLAQQANGINETQQTQIDQILQSINYLQASDDDFTTQINALSDLINTKLSDAPLDDKTYGRKNAAWSEIVAVNLSLPFFLTDGSDDYIGLTSDYELPFFLTDGTQQNIAMVTV